MFRQYLTVSEKNLFKNQQLSMSLVLTKS